MSEKFGLSDNAVKIFKDLYSFQEEKIGDTFERVSNEFGTNKEEKDLAFRLLSEGYWRPNTPVFLNAGTKHKVFSACYVVGLEDSMNSIYDIADVCRKIFQYGAGVGIPIGNLREKSAWIYEGNEDKLPEGKSSGPITFMKLYDAVGESTKSGGRVRRAAILVSMPVWHPDIMDFIKCKQTDGRLSNMNISVLITDKFMQALEDKVPFDLRSPYDGKKMGQIDPQEVWDQISEMSWLSADPGVLFIDAMNKYNPLIKDILIEATNPCGEQPLWPFNACNLSAINIWKFVRGINDFDWDGLYETTRKVMKLMDNLIDVMDFPDDDDIMDRHRFRTNTLKHRPVGIGPMGLADAMYKIGYKYNGADGRKFASEIMRVMTCACAIESANLAGKKGPFDDYEKYKEDVERIIEEHTGGDEDTMERVRKYGVRNCQFTTCQPTGTTALSCDSSYGIEPIMGLVFQKNLISGDTMMVVNPVFEERFKNEDWYTQELPDKIFKNGGSLKGLRGIPKEVKNVFVTAHDIKYKDRIDMQAALQKYCSTAISSTVNLSKETTSQEMADLYEYAYKKGLKGITVYRDGSKKNQPVTFTEEKKKHEEFDRPKVLDAKTHVVETGNGKMYVTVSHHKGKPLEIFIFLGKSGQILNTLTEAMGRVISIGLQQGVPVEEITKTLININSDKMVWYRFEDTDQRPTQILSIPDGVAKLLDRYYTGVRYNGELGGEICEKCGNFMTAMEGCFNCPACGHSKCS
jgi:ribonucleoside-diphosphate reductase alpha chain